jgi:archaellum biogenesis ATPase FlaH
MSTEKQIKVLESIEEQKDILKKQQFLVKHRINTQFNEVIKNQAEANKFKEIDLSKMDESTVQTLQVQADEYILAARKSMLFVNDQFNGIVPFFAKNLLLIGAATGSGKSTLCANIVYSCLLQGKKVLVLTNEQWEADIFNAVTALIKGWTYQDHDKITDEQRAVYREYIGKLSKRMTVVGDNYAGATGCTTSIEGIQTLLDSLIEKNIQYDVIIIDYYQNVATSKNNPRLEKWQVQERLAIYLDGFKNRYDAPIVVLSQLKPSPKDAEIDFKDRIEGRKSILNSATFAMEARADKEKKLTVWKIHKSRFKSIGKEILTGWEKGKYVKYDSAFMEKTQQSDVEKLLKSAGGEGDAEQKDN